jgi:hypothetical protein
MNSIPIRVFFYNKKTWKLNAVVDTTNMEFQCCANESCNLFKAVNDNWQYGEQHVLNMYESF